MKADKRLTLFRGFDSSKKENAAMASKIYTIRLFDGMNYEFVYFRNFIGFVNFT